jgi:hypothetical protein
MAGEFFAAFEIDDIKFLFAVKAEEDASFLFFLNFPSLVSGEKLFFDEELF